MFQEKPPLLAEYARSFAFEPYRIPSGSMLPDLQIGGFILVKKFTYNLDFPVFHWRLWHVANPKRGDVVVFHYPANPKVDFITRLIGLPGDHISYINKKLYINGKKVAQNLCEKRATSPFRESDCSGKTRKPTWSQT